LWGGEGPMPKSCEHEVHSERHLAPTSDAAWPPDHIRPPATMPGSTRPRRKTTPPRPAAGSPSAVATPATAGAPAPASDTPTGDAGAASPGVAPPLPDPPPTRKLPAELEAARDAEALAVLNHLGLGHWEAALRSNNWLHILQYTGSRQCDELSGLGALTAAKEADGKRAIGILRSRVGGAGGLPPDDGEALAELREISQAYAAASKIAVDTLLPKRAREDGQAQDVAAAPAKKPKFGDDVRDELLGNVAMTCGGIELDEAELPLDESIGTCWAAARTKPPTVVPYKATKFGRQIRGAPAVKRNKAGALEEDPARWKVLENFEAAVDTISIAHAFRLDDPSYAQYHGTAELDYLADADEVEAEASAVAGDADGAESTPVLVGSQLLELRKLSRAVRLACCEAGLSAQEADDHCETVWDDLQRLRNRSTSGRRRTLTAASVELRESGRATTVSRAPRQQSPASSSSTPPPPGDPEVTPAKKGGGQPPKGQCKGWWYSGRCSYDNCTMADSHEEETRGAGKKKK
jgi:hypothetical protein